MPKLEFPNSHRIVKGMALKFAKQLDELNNFDTIDFLFSICKDFGNTYSRLTQIKNLEGRKKVLDDRFLPKILHGHKNFSM